MTIIEITLDFKHTYDVDVPKNDNRKNVFALTNATLPATATTLQAGSFMATSKASWTRAKKYIVLCGFSTYHQIG